VYILHESVIYVKKQNFFLVDNPNSSELYPTIFYGHITPDRSYYDLDKCTRQIL